MHVAASIPNFVIMEKGSNETAQYDIFTGGWKATLAHSEVPEGRGLGVDISPKFLREYEVKS